MPNAGVYGIGSGAVIGVVSNVASSGVRSLALTDAPGLAQTYYPFFNYTPPDLTGNLNYAFDIRVAAETKMYHEWRDYPGGSYVAGPSLWIDRCALKVAGVTLTTIPSNQWVRLELGCDTATYASQGWRLGVTRSSQPTQWFSNLRSGGTTWSRLNWIGWVSENTNATTFYLDNLAMTNVPVYFHDPTPPAPTVTGLRDLVIAEDSSSEWIAFTLADAVYSVDALQVSASSSNQRLLPESHIVLAGNGAARMLKIIPVADETGCAIVNVTADNGVFHATATFAVTVVPVANDGIRGVELTTPLRDTTNAATVVLCAAADDPDGTLQRIEYSVDGVLVAASETWPFAVTVDALTYGVHTVQAVARDTQGFSAISAPAVFTNYLPPLAVSLLAADSTWRYYDATNGLDAVWRTAMFDDSAWKSGAALLGFGDANGRMPSTTVANNRQWTTYFRQKVVVSDPSRIVTLTARLLRDDGAAVYLNGTEVWRDNLPSGIISNATPASSSVGGAAENLWLTNAIPCSLLVPGTNVVAVEVHQYALSSSDLCFGFTLDATTVLPEEPRLYMAAGDQRFTLAWPSLDPGAFALYFSTNLVAPVSWQRIAETPILEGNFWRTAVPLRTNGCAFFRLLPK